MQRILRDLTSRFAPQRLPRRLPRCLDETELSRPHRLARSLAMALPLLGLLVGPAAAGGDARVLDDRAWVLTVGNWATVQVDGGTLRVESDRQLSYELRDLTGLLREQGAVPGTDDARIDGPPALSRNPATGEILLVWSRSNAGGTRELVSLGWQAGGWALVASGPRALQPDIRVLAAGLNNQTDPDLLHDQLGNAYITWRDGDWVRGIEFLVLDPAGAERARSRLSTEATVRNGPPRIGVDATGGLFVAHFGLDSSSGDPSLQVHSAADEGGGVVHLPSPVIELGRLGELSVVNHVPAPVPGSTWAPPRLEVSVLGGTPVLWWLTRDESGNEFLRHALRSPDGSWSELPIGSVSLTGLPDRTTALRDALEMIEARYRSVLSLVGNAPVLPPGRRLLGPELVFQRR